VGVDTMLLMEKITFVRLPKGARIGIILFHPLYPTFPEREINTPQPLRTATRTWNMKLAG
jgi:hypothetical protein